MAKQLTKNFNLAEFACKDGTPVPDELIPNVTAFAKNLQKIRDRINARLSVISGYRTKRHNKKIGGAPNSEHLKARAGDLASPALTPKQLHAVILDMIRKGEIPDGGLSLYPSWVHYDNGRPRRWYYGK